MRVSREGCGHRKARLSGSHGPHGGVDAPKIMKEAPGARLLFDDKDRGVPGGGSGLNVASCELFLHEGRGSRKLFRGEGPLSNPDGVI